MPERIIFSDAPVNSDVALSQLCDLVVIDKMSLQERRKRGYDSVDMYSEFYNMIRVFDNSMSGEQKELFFTVLRDYFMEQLAPRLIDDKGIIKFISDTSNIRYSVGTGSKLANSFLMIVGYLNLAMERVGDKNTDDSDTIAYVNSSMNKEVERFINHLKNYREEQHVNQ